MTIHVKKGKGIVHMGLDRHVSALLDILRMEIRSFNAMTELLILEEKCLVTSDTPSLSDVVGRQSDVLSSIACLEKSRVEIIGRIARETGRENAALTISEIARMTGEPLRKELVETADILSGIHGDMKRKKASNTLLVRQGMMMVENDMRLVLSLCGRNIRKQEGYTSSAGRDNRLGSVYLDGKV